MLNKLIQKACNRIMDSRPPDVVIGHGGDPYLLRWWVWKRNKWLNLYLHRVLRSDDDRALHDHPWINMSYIVEGEYNEVTYRYHRQFGDGLGAPSLQRTNRKQGTFKFRLPQALHRLELVEDYMTIHACTTLFLTGPRVRTWGFACPKGWVKWTDFTQKTPEGTFIAKGCGDMAPELLAQHPSKSGWWPKAPDGISEPSKGQTPRATALSPSAVNRP